MSKLIKNLVKYVAIPVVALGINGGCNNDIEYFSKTKEKDGLVMSAWNNGMGNHFRIDEGDDNTAGPYLHALDRYSLSDKDTLDERFDEISLRNVPKGHSIEKYANLDSINKLYQEVKETGVDVNY